MGAIMDAVIQFFEEDDWKYSQVEEDVLMLGFSGKHGNWTCYARAREDAQQFLFLSICPVKVPEHQRHLLAEFLTRANYGMLIGNFEMDFNDGEIRYKTSIDVENDRLTPALVHHLVWANVTTMDRYLPGIMAVLYGSADPAEAVAAVEN